MNEREKIIHLWFDMWLKQQDLGMDRIFTEDVVYTESWCPKYENLKTVKHWFSEWNTRGKVIIWDIKQFFHKGNQTVVAVSYTHLTIPTIENTENIITTSASHNEITA